MKKTPLHDRHAAAGARMAPFAGWMMPIRYEGIVPEHLRTRSRCSVFDVCHMGELEISGLSAAEDLERLLTCPIRSLRPGRIRYGFLLDERGGTIDDLTCYRLEEERFLLVVNAATTAEDAGWIGSHLSGSSSLRDLSTETAKLDVQGPYSRKVVEEALGLSLPELGYFQFTEGERDGVSFLISRTGYTGEWGYEIYLPAEAAGAWWDLLAAHPDCAPAGLGARDTLRLEMGYPLYGHELSRDRSPASVSGGMFIDLSKRFIGREAVAAELASPRERLTGLLLDGRRAARAGDRVFVAERPIGIVTSGSFAPSLGRAVALALLETAFTEPGVPVEIEVRGRRLKAETTSLPFYRYGTARAPQPPV